MADPPDMQDKRFADRRLRAEHVLLLHQGDGSCLEALRSVSPGGPEGQKVLAVVTPETRALIAPALGRSAVFEDVTEMGRNPARVIAAIRQFVENRGRDPRVYVVTEQWWEERELAERAELARHEALANLAFGGNDVHLVCLYDTRWVKTEIIEDAKRTHPLLADETGVETNPWFVDPQKALERVSIPLEPAPSEAETFEVQSGHLAELRSSVEARGHFAGLAPERVQDLVLAANEVATNVVSHGNGHGRLQMWTDDAWLVCEVTDEGRVEDPLIGTRTPPVGDTRGRGMWMVNQLCDLVELRSGRSGTAVRLRFARPGGVGAARTAGG